MILLKEIYILKAAVLQHLRRQITTKCDSLSHQHRKTTRLSVSEICSQLQFFLQYLLCQYCEVYLTTSNNDFFHGEVFGFEIPFKPALSPIIDNSHD